MAEKFFNTNNTGDTVRPVKIGQSFRNPNSVALHTIKYDFKPASVDTSKMATVDIGSNHEVTVTVPHLDGAGVPETVFKGSQRPYQKECVLIVDRVTGEITLEKLSSNIQVKKTRIKQSKIPVASSREGATSGQMRSAPAPGQRINSKTKVTTGGGGGANRHFVPKHSPLHASPNRASPKHNESSQQQVSQQQSPMAASLPMISDDETDMVAPSGGGGGDDDVGVMSDTSTSSSSTSTSSSDNDGAFNKDVNRTVIERKSTTTAPPPPTVATTTNGTTTATSTTTNAILNEDLCLSESGSDSN